MTQGPHHVPPTARELLVTVGWCALSVALTFLAAFWFAQVLPHEEPRQHEHRGRMPLCSASQGCFA